MLTSRSAPWEDLYLEHYVGQSTLGHRFVLPHPSLFLRLTEGNAVAVSVDAGPAVARPSRPGELSMLPPMTLVDASAQSTGEFLFVSIAPRAWARALPDHAPGELVARFGIDDPLLRSAILALHAEARAGYPGGASYGRLLASMLLAHLKRHYLAPRDSRPAVRGALPQAMTERVAAYIEAHLDQALPLSEVASVVHLSPFHFARTFRRARGLSVHRYILQRRVERARTLLLEGASVTEAARRVGFCDQSHLSMHFRRKFGVTPGRFASEHAARAR